MAKSDKTSEDIDAARDVIDAEIAALQRLSQSLDHEFSQAVDLVTGCTGYVIVTGLGKSGHVGRKLAATLASTGTPAFFVHPTEASHGDLGMIGRDGIVIAISNSGETRELRDLLTYCRRQNVTVIAITGRRDSFLGTLASCVLELPDADEAGPAKLAPTSSTAMTLALGDALALTVMGRRGFSREEFGERHPGGIIGMHLQSIAQWIEANPEAPNPTVTQDAVFVDVLQAIAEGLCGAVSVTDANGALVGFITDGDIRRAVAQNKTPQSLTAATVLSEHPVTMTPQMRIVDAIELLETRRISQIVVTDQNQPKAIIHIKDLMQAGYI